MPFRNYIKNCFSQCGCSNVAALIMGFQNYIKNCLSKNWCSKVCALKLFSFAVCFCGFFIISWRLMEDFLEQKTVVSSTFLKTSDESLLSPSMLICNHTAFKSLRFNTKLEDYLDDTVDIKDIFVDTGFIGNSKEPQLLVDKIRPIYTPYKGKCFVFEPAIKVITVLL